MIQDTEHNPSSTDLEAVGVEPRMVLHWHHTITLSCQDLIS
jgi:hypothetical protein